MEDNQCPHVTGIQSVHYWWHTPHMEWNGNTINDCPEVSETFIYYKSSYVRSPSIYHCISLPVTPSHMDTYTKDLNVDTINRHTDTALEDIMQTTMSLSDPEDDDTSSVESFNEDELYDVSDNGDEVVCERLDFPMDGTVCSPLHSCLPAIS